MKKVRGPKSGFVFQFLNSDADESKWVEQMDSMYALYKDAGDRCLGYQSGESHRYIFAYTDPHKDWVDVWFQQRTGKNDV